MDVTLKQVAESSGVSIRTAGRALNGSGPVKAEVAERVRLMAQKLGYIPNAAARSLRNKSQNIVGIICPEQLNIEIHNRRMNYLQKRLRNHNLHALIAQLPNKSEELTQLLHSWTGLVNHLIFLDWSPLLDAEKLLLHLPMRSIFIDNDPQSEKFDHLITARAEGVRCGVEALIAHGCRRIAHIKTPAKDRAAGFNAAIDNSTTPVESVCIDISGFDISNGYNIGEKIVASKVDGVFFDNDRIALGFYRYAYEHNIQIAKDIAIVGFDNDTADEFAIPSLSSVAHPYEEEIEKAMEIITASSDNMPIQKITYPSTLITRESIKIER